jgi:Arc/MetJ-type ribon-helix-helix transcriptional regulator
MEITLPTDLNRQLQLEVANGHFADADQLIAEAVRFFLADRQRRDQQLACLRRVGDAVDGLGLYDRVLLPGAN